MNDPYEVYRKVIFINYNGLPYLHLAGADARCSAWSFSATLSAAYPLLLGPKWFFLDKKDTFAAG